MPRPTLDIPANFDDIATKRRVQSFVGSIRGEYDVTIEPRRPTLSGKQRRYYFACIVTPLMDFLNAQDFQSSKEGVHQILKEKNLAKHPIYNPVTGELLSEQTRSLMDLSVEEMSNYIESCIAWLAATFDIPVDEPQPTWSSPVVPLTTRQPKEVGVTR